MKNSLICFFLIILMGFQSLSFAQTPLHIDPKLHVKNVLLVVAMDKEAQPIIDLLKLNKLPHAFAKLPMQAYQGKYANLNILLVTNGLDPINKVANVGTQAATLTTYLGIQFFHPDLIVNIGTAGGVNAYGAREKDIFISQKIYFYARRIPFPGYSEYGLGAYSSPSLKYLQNNFTFKFGTICSGDSFDNNATDYAMFLKLKCDAVDMEAAGVAWVSMLVNTPMVAIKGITNFVRGDDIQAQYEKNVGIVINDLSIKLKDLLRFIAEPSTQK